MVLQEPVQVILSNSWAGRLEKSLRSERDELETLAFINYGQEGYSTKDLLEDKKIDAVIHDKPDLVIFENPLINNQYQSISLEQTEKDLKNIMSKLQKKLPNAKILIISPNPVANGKTKNSLGLIIWIIFKLQRRSSKQINGLI